MHSEPPTADGQPQTMISLRGMSKRFGATVALDDVDLEARAGEVLALVGENGSGKSTLMRILAGALPADGGEMTLDGQPYRPRSPLDARKAGIAMIHQELSLCPDLAVWENVLLGMEDAALLPRNLMRKRAQAALEELGHADLDVDTQVARLPIGVRQLVEIARAVAVGSKVVVLDEPTSSLTEADAERLFAVVETLRSKGRAVIYISHFLDEIHRLADRIVVLRDGRSVAQLPSKAPDDVIVAHMVGREIEDMYPRSVRTPGEAVLSLQGMVSQPKVEDVSLTLHRGEVLGIGGLNGSGRTELLRAVFGLQEVRGGEVRVGLVAGPASPARRWSQGVGMLSEDRKLEGLALEMSIAENITLASLRTPALNPRTELEAAARWIERLAIKCQGPAQSVGALSGGNQQKVAIARLLHHGVDVLLLDEPTRGIDVGSKEQIYALIDSLAAEGKAVLMVSSYLPELLGTCDRIAVMRRGRLGPAHPVAESSQESLMHEAVGG